MTDAGVDARNLTPEEAEREALQTEAEAHRTVLTAQRAQLATELERARGLRRTNLRRSIRRIDRELVREPRDPAIASSSAASAPPK